MSERSEGYMSYLYNSFVMHGIIIIKDVSDFVPRFTEYCTGRVEFDKKPYTSVYSQRNRSKITDKFIFIRRD